MNTPTTSPATGALGVARALSGDAREAFEHWFSGAGESPLAVQRSGGGYYLMQAQSAWSAWEAAWRYREAREAAEAEALRAEVERLREQVAQAHKDYREAEREFAREAREIAAEARWEERQSRDGDYY